MINDFIQQIITLDDKSEARENEIIQSAEKIRSQTLDEIKSEEKSTLEKVKQSDKDSYDKAIEQAKAQREALIEQANEEYKLKRAQFDAVKQEAASKVLELLLKKE